MTSDRNCRGNRKDCMPWNGVDEWGRHEFKWEFQGKLHWEGAI